MKRTFEILISICLLLSLNITLCGCTDMMIETGSPIYHHVYVDRYDRYPIYIHPTPPPPHVRLNPPTWRHSIKPTPRPNPRSLHFGHGQRR